VVHDELPPATKVKLYSPVVAPTDASPTANGGVAGLHAAEQILISTAVEGPGAGETVPDTLIVVPEV
jgi:hypothetical protein